MSDLIDPTPLPEGLSIPVEDGQQTPLRVRMVMRTLLNRLEALAARVHRDSSNARRPPSTDSAETKRQRRTTAADRRQPGGTPGHPGHPQVLVAPPATVALFPDACAWGHHEGAALTPYHPPQVLELPLMRPEGPHWMLSQGRCRACGTRGTVPVPSAHASGYGPRLTGGGGERAGRVGASRSAGQDLCASVLRIPLSTGAIQQRGERGAEAIVPHDAASGAVARTASVNYLAETAWRTHGTRHGLWGMANPEVAYVQSPATAPRRHVPSALRTGGAS